MPKQGPKRGRRPGQNIRELALKRRVKAVTAFVGAGLAILMPLLFVRAWDNFGKQIPSNHTSLPQTSSNVPPVFYGMLMVTAAVLVTNGLFLWKRANHADQGARGEEDVSRELSQLEWEGWKIEYGMRLGNGLGDADIVCISPQDKAYVIDVKSHKGEVVVAGEQLHRRLGTTSFAFEKNFIDRAMKQALQVKKQKSLKFVTPILAFSQAKVSVPAHKLRQVYVVEKSKLLSLLKSLG